MLFIFVHCIDIFVQSVYNTIIKGKEWYYG